MLLFPDADERMVEGNAPVASPPHCWVKVSSSDEVAVELTPDEARAGESVVKRALLQSLHSADWFRPRLLTSRDTVLTSRLMSAAIEMFVPVADSTALGVAGLQSWL